MGKMTWAEVVATLTQTNPHAGDDRIAMYADCFMDYQEAQMNITKNGTIVFHPRTGSPISNPYAEVKARAMATMLQMLAISGAGLRWDTTQKGATPEPQE